MFDIENCLNKRYHRYNKDNSLDDYTFKPSKNWGKNLDVNYLNSSYSCKGSNPYPFDWVFPTLMPSTSLCNRSTTFDRVKDESERDFDDVVERCQKLRLECELDTLEDRLRRQCDSKALKYQSFDSLFKDLELPFRSPFHRSRGKKLNNDLKNSLQHSDFFKDSVDEGIESLRKDMSPNAIDRYINTFICRVRAVTSQEKERYEKKKVIGGRMKKFNAIKTDNLERIGIPSFNDSVSNVDKMAKEPIESFYQHPEDASRYRIKIIMNAFDSYVNDVASQKSKLKFQKMRNDVLSKLKQRHGKISTYRHSMDDKMEECVESLDQDPKDTSPRGIKRFMDAYARYVSDLASQEEKYRKKQNDDLSETMELHEKYKLEKLSTLHRRVEDSTEERIESLDQEPKDASPPAITRFMTAYARYVDEISSPESKEWLQQMQMDSDLKSKLEDLFEMYIYMNVDPDQRPTKEVFNAAVVQYLKEFSFSEDDL